MCRPMMVSQVALQHIASAHGRVHLSSEEEGYLGGLTHGLGDPHYNLLESEVVILLSDSSSNVLMLMPHSRGRIMQVETIGQSSTVALTAGSAIFRHPVATHSTIHSSPKPTTLSLLQCLFTSDPQQRVTLCLMWRRTDQ